MQGIEVNGFNRVEGRSLFAGLVCCRGKSTSSLALSVRVEPNARKKQIAFEVGVKTQFVITGSCHRVLKKTQMAKHTNFKPIVGDFWTEALSDDPLILNELKRLGISHYLTQSKEDLTMYGKNKRLILRHITGQAILVWEKQRVEPKKYGIRCVLFVNNSQADSVDLLGEAMKLARLCWIEYSFLVNIDPKLFPKNAEKIFVNCGWKPAESTGNVLTYTSDFGLLSTRKKDMKQNCGKGGRS
jgi:hypothetical protein